MPSVLQWSLMPLGAVVAYKVTSTAALAWHNSSESKKRGCGSIPTLPSPDFFGAYNVYELIKAAGAGNLPQHIQGRLQTVRKREQRDVLTYQLHIFRGWLITTTDPKNIQAILATQFKEFELGPIRFGTFSPLLGNGIFSSDGKRWEHSRALLRPQFVRDQVSDLDLEETHFQNMLKAMPVYSSGWTEMNDILPLFFRLTMDSASEFLLGESVDSQLAALPGSSGSDKNTVEQDAAFVKAFEASQDCISFAFRFNDYYSIGLTKQYYAYAKTCHDYINRTVERVLARSKTRSLEAGEKEKYVFLEKLAEATQDRIEIRDQILSILVAGRDTTASLLSFLFVVLGQKPEIFEKLRSVIINDFGTYESTDNITFASLKGCTYLQWCLNEILRLFPTVPLNSRRSIVDTTLPRGGGPDGLSPVFVPKGTEVNYSVYVMHRDKTIWGPDAEEFVPERWQGRKPGFEYLPFNGGPRICLGQQFALTEAGYIVVRMLQRFDKIDGSAVAGMKEDWFLTLTGRPMHGVNLKFHAAA